MGGFVVGVSGGIDSAIIYIMAKTGLNVICLEMPIQQKVNKIVVHQLI